MSQPGLEYFNSKTVEDLLLTTWSNDKVISIPVTAPMWQAVKILAQNKIHSAPIIGKDNSLKGVLSVWDVVKFVVAKSPNLLVLDDTKRRQLKNGFNVLADSKVSDIIDMKILVRHYVTLNPQDPISKASFLLSHGAGLILVQSKEAEHITHLITSTDIAKYLRTYIKDEPSLKALGEKKLSELGFAASAVTTVRQDDTVFSCMKACLDHGDEAVAVLDYDNHLIGNFSELDIKGFYQEDFPRFLEGVKDFLLAYSPESLKAHTCTLDTTLTDALFDMVMNRKRQLWLVDEEHKPIGVVTLPKLIRAFMSAKL